MTNLEKAFAKMTPAQRKKASAAISEQMGMPSKKTGVKKSTARKKK